VEVGTAEVECAEYATGPKSRQDAERTADGGKGVDPGAPPLHHRNDQHAQQNAAEQDVDEVAARVQRDGIAAGLEVRIGLDLVGIHDEDLACAVVDHANHPDVGTDLGGAHRGDDVGVADFG